MFAPFSKTSLNIHLLGVTNDDYDSSVDSIHQSLIPLLKNSYNFDNELQMKVIKRGYLPLAGGDVHLVCPSIRSLNKVNLS